jgi:hypothetical protein
MGTLGAIMVLFSAVSVKYLRASHVSVLLDQQPRQQQLSHSPPLPRGFHHNIHTLHVMLVNPPQSKQR